MSPNKATATSDEPIVLKLPLLHLDDRTDWAEWFTAVGVIGPDMERAAGAARNRRVPRTGRPLGEERAPLTVIVTWRTLMLVGLLGGGLVELAAADPMSQSENLMDRPGGDYFSYQASGFFPECSSSCATDTRCRAYTFVLANNMCYKKDTVPAALANNCCISGVKLMGAMEFSTDRPGSDIRSFDSPDPNSCETACREEPACQAYTWVRAGIQGPTAKCWLKNTTPANVSNNCCVSGVRLPRLWRVPGDLINPSLPARP